MESRHLRSVRIPISPILIGVLLAVLLSSSAPCPAQDSQQVIPSPTPVREPTPIPASQIPDRVGQVAALLRTLEADAQPTESIGRIINRLDDVDAAISTLEIEVQPLLAGDGPPQALKDAGADLVRIDRRLTGWLTALNDMTADFDVNLQDLRIRKETWELTRVAAAEQDLPEALVDQVRDTIAAIGATEKVVADRRVELLTTQANVVEKRGRLRALGEALEREVAARQEHLFRFDSPPLWKALDRSRVDSDLQGEVSGAIQRNIDVVERFVTENARVLIRDVLVYIFVLLFFIWLGRWASLWVRTDQTLRTTAALLAHPVASSLLVTIIVVGGVVHPTAPTPAQNLTGVVLLLAVLRLLPHLVRPEMKPAIGMLVSLIVLYLLVDLVPSAYFLHRVGELGLAVLGCAACSWALFKERRATDIDRDIWYWGATWVAAAAIVFFAVSALANIVGAVAFASLLASATLGSIHDAITLWVFALVVLGVVTVTLRTAVAQRLLIVRHHSDRIREVLFKAIKIVAVAVWFAAVLSHFQLLGWASERIKGFFLAEIGIGEFSLSVSSVAVFAVVIWLSIKLAQFTSFVLDEDVLPRLELPKGVPATISKTTTYLLVTLGVVVAVTAAGLDLSKATIIIGALGVGIGFGLQNAVNNFVSGLILLFGRPINVEDRIQIGDISGVVMDIGIRATVVRTWQGAEVIVPNATLISDNLINWTLSDTRRRMEIPVGVAYGSPTAKVIELLTEVARAHPEVLEDPEPHTLFQGFGDSSLDFELRAWTEGDFIAIASDLRLGIDRILAENGIVIPFPQRDLHIQSVEPGAAERLTGNDPGSEVRTAAAGDVGDETQSVP
jgi:potassium efflux system protein